MYDAWHRKLNFLFLSLNGFLSGGRMVPARLACVVIRDATFVFAEYTKTML